jgi:hypothetical protein
MLKGAGYVSANIQILVFSAFVRAIIIDLRGQESSRGDERNRC